MYRTPFQLYTEFRIIDFLWGIFVVYTSLWYLSSSQTLFCIHNITLTKDNTIIPIWDTRRLIPEYSNDGNSGWSHLICLQSKFSTYLAVHNILSVQRAAWADLLCGSLFTSVLSALLLLLLLFWHCQHLSASWPLAFEFVLFSIPPTLCNLLSRKKMVNMLSKWFLAREKPSVKFCWAPWQLLSLCYYRDITDTAVWPWGWVNTGCFNTVQQVAMDST